MFPAPAGINRILTVWRIVTTRVPRASGDKPEYVGDLLALWECSPRQRG
ncbi:hypothetical protein IB325_002725 [Salmonella enterica subsp. enterica serovar Ank]|nr:hypothetical protein [Salmonella enterica subsp. enterica serovar Ank]